MLLHFQKHLTCSDKLFHTNSSKSQEFKHIESFKIKKRHRTIFSGAQLDILEDAFQKTHYPHNSLKECIAKVTELNEERVEVRSSNKMK